MPDEKPAQQKSRFWHICKGIAQEVSVGYTTAHWDLARGRSALPNIVYVLQLLPQSPILAYSVLMAYHTKSVGFGRPGCEHTC